MPRLNTVVTIAVGDTTNPDSTLAHNSLAFCCRITLLLETALYLQQLRNIL